MQYQIKGNENEYKIKAKEGSEELTTKFFEISQCDPSYWSSEVDGFLGLFQVKF